MNSKICHIELNVSNLGRSKLFYKQILEPLGYTITHDGLELCGFSKGKAGGWIWLVQADLKYIRGGYHRKRIGLNHVAFMVDSRDDVDDFTGRVLKSHKISTLYSTPKYFPEYDKTYYAVFFEDPDRVKLEVCSWQ